MPPLRPSPPLRPAPLLPSPSPSLAAPRPSPRPPRLASLSLPLPLPLASSAALSPPPPPPRSSSSRRAQGLPPLVLPGPHQPPAASPRPSSSPPRSPSASRASALVPSRSACPPQPSAPSAARSPRPSPRRLGAARRRRRRSRQRQPRLESSAPSPLESPQTPDKETREDRQLLCSRCHRGRRGGRVLLSPIVISDDRQKAWAGWHFFARDSNLMREKCQHGQVLRPEQRCTVRRIAELLVPGRTMRRRAEPPSLTFILPCAPALQAPRARCPSLSRSPSSQRRHSRPIRDLVQYHVHVRRASKECCCCDLRSTRLGVVPALVSGTVPG